MGRRDAKARRHAKSRPQGILEMTARGFGFVKTAEGEFFIPPSKINGAFPGDLVEVSRISSQRQEGASQIEGDYHQRPTGRIVRVLMREQRLVVGRYEVAEPFGVVVPEDPCIPYDVFTLRKDAPHVKDGDIVEVEMLEYPSRNTAATGKVVRVLGCEDDEDVEVDLIIARLKLETEFGKPALDEAAALKLDVATALVRGYRDLRDRPIITIDPVDARDYDDAVSCRFEDGRYHLGVYIADVSACVPYNGSVDLEARRRATSVYLVDRVLPMLPERISNDLCSLVPGQPRLTMAVEAVIRADGMVESYDVFPAVISSKARLSYDQALALMECPLVEGDDVTATLHAAYRACEPASGALPLPAGVMPGLRETVTALSDLSRKLFALRYQAGCMDFDRTEAKVRLDPSGVPVSVDLRRRTPATAAIEEAMILANRLVATWLIDRGMPCVFRLHDAPDGEALYALHQILSEMPGYGDIDEWRFCSGDPHVLQEVLERSRGKEEHELVSFLMLRSMKRAVYGVEDKAHYGVALEHYCHFTSPIRRYPDLLVHRMVKFALFGETETSAAQKAALPWMAEHSSKMERLAEKAAFESQNVKLIEYLQKDVGQTFSGVISGVSTFGIYVRLKNTATGHIALSDLGDEYFSFDPERHLLVGVDSGVCYQLGQTVQAVLVEANPRHRRLTMRLSHRSHRRHRSL